VYYCTRKRKETSEFLTWVQIGFDALSWILIGISYMSITSYVYFKNWMLVQMDDKKKSSLSWLTGISLLLGKDYTPLFNKTLALFSFCSVILSSIYLCFVKGECTAPFHPMPYETFKELIDHGYRFSFWKLSEPEKKLVKLFMFQKNNISFNSKIHEHVPNIGIDLNDYNVDEIMWYYDENKIASKMPRQMYNYLKLSIHHCHILPKEFFTIHDYYTFSGRFQTFLADSFQRLFASGLENYISATMDYRIHHKYLRKHEIAIYKENLPIVMRIGNSIYTVFVILAILLGVCLLAFVREMKMITFQTIYKLIRSIFEAFSRCKCKLKVRKMMVMNSMEYSEMHFEAY
jgi:hypothetical protein